MSRFGTSNKMRAGTSVSGSGALQAALTLPVGTMVLFSDEEEAWRAAKVVAITPASIRVGGGLELTVRFRRNPSDTHESMETVILPAGQLPLVADEAALEACDDLTQVEEVHESTVLHALDLRFRRGRVYTRVGEILIAVKPPPASLLASDVQRDASPEDWSTSCSQFSARTTQVGDEREDAAGPRGLGLSEDAAGAAEPREAPPPHLFEVAERCYASAARHTPGRFGGRFGISQVVVVGGESGAGKTACAHKLVDYLLFAASKHTAWSSPSPSLPPPPPPPLTGKGGRGGFTPHSLATEPSSVVGFAERSALTHVHTVLGSFGHAACGARNQDSSRFGRLTEVGFDCKGRVAQVRVGCFLLETLRCAEHCASERSFHVFYELLAGASEGEKRRWHLDGVKARELRYLRPHPATTTPFTKANAGTASSSSSSSSSPAMGSSLVGRFLRTDGVVDADQWSKLQRALAALRLEGPAEPTEEQVLEPCGGGRGGRGGGGGGLPGDNDDSSSSPAPSTYMSAYDPVECVLKTVAAVLLLGQVAFEDTQQGPSSSSSSSSSSTSTSSTSTSTSGEGGDTAKKTAAAGGYLIAGGLGGCQLVASSARDLHVCSFLLGVSERCLLDAITLRPVAVSETARAAIASAGGGEAPLVVTVGRSAGAANDARDALAKQLFGHAFDFLVGCLNRSLRKRIGAKKESGGEEKGEEGGDGSGPLSPSTTPTPSAPPSSRAASCSSVVGVLDVFGFERGLGGGLSAVASLEHFVVNYANEVLQRHFVSSVFEAESELYRLEDVVPWVKEFEFPDNTLVLRLIEGGRNDRSTTPNETAAAAAGGGGGACLISLLDEMSGTVDDEDDEVNGGGGGDASSGQQTQKQMTEFPTKKKAVVNGSRAAATLTSKAGLKFGSTAVARFKSFASATTTTTNAPATKSGSGQGGGGGGSLLTATKVASAPGAPLTLGLQVTHYADQTVAYSMASRFVEKNRRTAFFVASTETATDTSGGGGGSSFRTIKGHRGPCFLPGRYSPTQQEEGEGMTAMEEEEKERGPTQLSSSSSSSSSTSSTSLSSATMEVPASMVTSAKVELEALRNTLTRLSSHTHFVRCLSASSPSSPVVFDRLHMCAQLKSSGVLDAVRMVRSGFPVRWALAAFAARYAPLAYGPALPLLVKSASSSSSSSGLVAGSRGGGEDNGGNEAAAGGSSSSSSGGGGAGEGSAEIVRMVTYRVLFREASLGFGVKFVRSGMPVVARLTDPTGLGATLMLGHILTHVGRASLEDTKEQTYFDAKASGVDPSKAFQKAVATLLRETPRPLLLSFAGPCADAQRLTCFAALSHFADRLEPAHIQPLSLQRRVLDALLNTSGGSVASRGGGVLAALGVAVGARTVFLRQEAASLLDGTLSSLLHATAVVLQRSAVKPWLKRRKLKASKRLQAWARGTAARQAVTRLKRVALEAKAAATVAHALRKARTARRRRAAVAIQSLTRRCAVRKEGASRRSAAVVVQKYVRRTPLSATLLKQRKAEASEVAGLRERLKAHERTIANLQQQQSTGGAVNELRGMRSRGWDEKRVALEGSVARLEQALHEEKKAHEKSERASAVALASAVKGKEKAGLLGTHAEAQANKWAAVAARLEAEKSKAFDTETGGESGGDSGGRRRPLGPLGLKSALAAVTAALESEKLERWRLGVRCEDAEVALASQLKKGAELASWRAQAEEKLEALKVATANTLAVNGGGGRDDGGGGGGDGGGDGGGGDNFTASAALTRFEFSLRCEGEDARAMAADLAVKLQRSNEQVKALTQALLFAGIATSADAADGTDGDEEKQMLLFARKPNEKKQQAQKKKRGTAVTSVAPEVDDVGTEGQPLRASFAAQFAASLAVDDDEREDNDDGDENSGNAGNALEEESDEEDVDDETLMKEAALEQQIRALRRTVQRLAERLADHHENEPAVESAAAAKGSSGSGGDDDNDAADDVDVEEAERGERGGVGTGACLLLRCELAAARADAQGEAHAALEASRHRRRLSGCLAAVTKAYHGLQAEQSGHQEREAAAALAAGRVRQAHLELDTKAGALQAQRLKLQEDGAKATRRVGEQEALLKAAVARGDKLELQLVGLVDEMASSPNSFSASSSSSSSSSASTSSAGSMVRALALEAEQASPAFKELERKHAEALVVLRHEAVVEAEAALEEHAFKSSAAVHSLEGQLAKAIEAAEVAEQQQAVVEKRVGEMLQELAVAAAKAEGLEAQGAEAAAEVGALAVREETAQRELGCAVAKLGALEGEHAEVLADLKQHKAVSYSAVSSLEGRLSHTLTVLSQLTADHALTSQEATAADTALAVSEATCGRLSRALSEAEAAAAGLQESFEESERGRVSGGISLAEERRRVKEAHFEVERLQGELRGALGQAEGAKTASAQVAALERNLAASSIELEASRAKVGEEVARRASVEKELQQVGAFKQQFGAHVSRAQGLELHVSELEALVEEHKQKGLASEAAAKSLEGALEAVEVEKASHCAALAEALESVALMQERAAKAQRRVWQTKCAKLEQQVRDLSSSPAPSSSSRSQSQGHLGHHSRKAASAASSASVAVEKPSPSSPSKQMQQSTPNDSSSGNSSSNSSVRENNKRPKSTEKENNGATTATDKAMTEPPSTTSFDAVVLPVVDLTTDPPSSGRMLANPRSGEGQEETATAIAATTTANGDGGGGEETSRDHHTGDKGKLGILTAAAAAAVPATGSELLSGGPSFGGDGGIVDGEVSEEEDGSSVESKEDSEEEEEEVEEWNGDGMGSVQGAHSHDVI